jgi:hypothetical protein
MKVQIECPDFRAYLQKMIPAAFDNDGLMDTEHKAVKSVKHIDIEPRGVSTLSGIEYLPNLQNLDVDLNPNIKHLPRLPSTLKEFYSNHKFDTSVQPVFFYRMWNYLLLDNGRVLHGSTMWDSLDDFKASVVERYDAEKFAPFITECEQYLKKINHVQ